MKIIARYVGITRPNFETNKTYVLTINGNNNIKIWQNKYLIVYNNIIEFLSEWDELKKL